MRRVDRETEPPPAFLQGPEASRSRIAMRDFMRFGAEKMLQTSAPRTELPLEDVSLNRALERLFRGKCAFCEAFDTIAPYRFRPASEALPFDSTNPNWHLYYVWLSDAWENIYAICPTCRPDEPSFFPVQGERARLPTDKELDRYVEESVGLWRQYPLKEKSELLDPCSKSNFEQHFHVQVDGALVGLTSRGTASIHQFKLNRPERVAQRGEAYQSNFEQFIASLRNPPKRGAVEAYLQFDGLAFGGTWEILLARLGLGLNFPLGSTTTARFLKAFKVIADDADAEEAVRSAWKALQEEDSKGLQSEPAQRPSQAGKARLTCVEITNFKAIENLVVKLPDSDAAATTFTEEHPAPSLLILGENAAGKSSILEAIALALSDQKARNALGLKRDGLVLNPAYLGASGAVRPTQAEVTLSLQHGEVSRICRTVVSKDSFQDRRDPDAEEIAVFAYGAFRQYQDDEIPYAPGKYIRNLFDGSELSRPERWLISLDKVRFGEVVRALRDILAISTQDASDEASFDVIECDKARRRCYLVTEVEDGRGHRSRARTPLSAVSSGFRSVLAMACDIMQGLMDSRVYAGFETLRTARGVVLIDEVEAHLHPRWKMQIMRGLRRALPNMTIIATTHDPLCLRSMKDKEVVVLQRVASADSSQESDLPELVEQLAELPEMSTLGVEQLLTSDFFQLYSTDAPEIDARLAKVSDLLADRGNGKSLEKVDLETLESFERDIATAMPIGFSSAHRLVQEAVADYLKERRKTSEARMRELRAASKARIIRALKGI